MVERAVKGDFLLRRGFENELGRDGDRCLQASIHRTFIGKDSMNAHGGFPMSFPCFQSHPHMNTPDHEYILLQLDFTHGLANQVPGGCVYLTRLQRAPKGSYESACCRRDDVVERGCVRFGHSRRDLVVFRNGAMHTENNRF
jgi:hypothetical protein